MNFRPNHVLSTLLFCYLSLTFFSCSKDSDLLSDYVITDASDGAIAGRVLDDTYFVSFSSSTVLDVLANDNFEEGSNVVITGTSEPAAGQAIVNEDNTITYIPDETATEDSFNYLTEQTQGDGTVSSGEGTVTIAQSGTESRFATTGTNVYYVTINGKSTNNGKSESASWDLGHAVKAAKAGDIVYIKAGLYSDFNLTQSNNGTNSNPIRFVGYKSAPGDINPDAQQLYTLGTQTIRVLSSFKYGDEVDATKMPLLREARSGKTGLGTAFSIRGNHVELYNLQTLYYENGLYNHGDNNQFKNIIHVDLGNFSKDVRDGNGILNFGNNCIYKNIYIQNAADQGFTIQGNNGLYQGITVCSDNNVNATDYYFLFQNGQNNVATDIHVLRVGDIQHDGHGLVFKTPDPCHNNLVDGFIVDDTNLEAQYPGVYDNIIRNGYVLRRPITRAQLAGGVRLINGSHDNLFEDIFLDGMGIMFMDWNGDAPGNETNSSDNNVFHKITTVNAKDAVAFSYFQSNHNTGYPENNTFYNCTFYNLEYMFEDSRRNENTKFINCVFSKVARNIHTATGYSTYPVNISYLNSNFYDFQFTVPNATNILKFDPLFKDVNNYNFSLKDESSLKGKGIATPFLPEGNTLGAFQD